LRPMPIRRPAPDLRRGSWFAQQGGSGLRFGGLPGSGAIPSARARSPSLQAAAHLSSRGLAARTSVNSSAETDVSDALDELLSHARVTLKSLDGLRAQQVPKAQVDPKPRSSARGAAAFAPRVQDPRKAPSFWKPQCGAHLWSGGTAGTLSDDDLDDDLASSSESESGDPDWDYLRRGYGQAGASLRPGAGAGISPQASAASSRPPPMPRGASVPPPQPPSNNNNNNNKNDKNNNNNSNNNNCLHERSSGDFNVCSMLSNLWFCCCLQRLSALIPFFVSHRRGMLS